MATPSNLYGLLGAVNTKDKWGHADKPAEASWRYRAVWAKEQSRILSNLCFRWKIRYALFELGYHDLSLGGVVAGEG
jgi:hypothetical protein